MGYEYDIFVSYKNGHASEWIHQLLLPCLEVQLEFSLGYLPKIFTDRGVEAGSSWPLRLQTALAKSKCVIPIFQPAYFNSDWCNRELNIILKREKNEKFRTLTNTLGLALPITIGDGEFFPKYAQAIQWIDCSSYYTQCSAKAYRDTNEFREFEKFIKSKSTEIAYSIQAAPNWKELWLTEKLPPPPAFKKTKKMTAPIMG